MVVVDSFICGTCNKAFPSGRHARDRHCTALGHEAPEFECDTCPRYFKSEQGRFRHMEACGHFAEKEAETETHEREATLKGGETTGAKNSGKRKGNRNRKKKSQKREEPDKLEETQECEETRKGEEILKGEETKETEETEGTEETEETEETHKEEEAQKPEENQKPEEPSLWKGLFDDEGYDNADYRTHIANYIDHVYAGPEKYADDPDFLARNGYADWDEYYDNNFDCELCEATLPSMEDFEKHGRDEHFYCYECSLQLKDRDSIDQHVRSSDHVGSGLDGIGIMCPFCQFSFTSAATLVSHYERRACHAALEHGAGEIWSGIVDPEPMAYLKSILLAIDTEDVREAWASGERDPWDESPMPRGTKQCPICKIYCKKTKFTSQDALMEHLRSSAREYAVAADLSP